MPYLRILLDGDGSRSITSPELSAEEVSEQLDEVQKHFASRQGTLALPWARLLRGAAICAFEVDHV